MPALANKPLANPKHLAFIRCVAMGQTATDAYRATVATDPRNTGCHVGGARLRAKYALQIEELHERLKQAAEAKLILTKVEAAEFYSAVVRANPAKLEGQEYLAQEAVSWVDSGGNTRTRFKLPPKADCLSALAKLMGWNEAEKHDHAHIHALVDSPALRALEGCMTKRSPDAATGTAEGSNGHLAPVWMDPDELFEAELVPVESSQNG